MVMRASGEMAFELRLKGKGARHKMDLGVFGCIMWLFPQEAR